MGRRARNRVRASNRDASAKRDRMARVRIDEQTWREFRQLVGPQPIAERLGELVSGEVAAHRRRRIREGVADDREVVDALERALELGRSLAAITDRLELLRAPHRHVGGPQRAAAHRPTRVEGGERPRGEPDWWPGPSGDSAGRW